VDHAGALVGTLLGALFQALLWGSLTCLAMNLTPAGGHLKRVESLWFGSLVGGFALVLGLFASTFIIAIGVRIRLPSIVRPPAIPIAREKGLR
jgi:hypothetical protein